MAAGKVQEWLKRVAALPLPPPRHLRLNKRICLAVIHHYVPDARIEPEPGADRSIGGGRKMPRVPMLQSRAACIKVTRQNCKENAPYRLPELVWDPGVPPQRCMLRIRRVLRVCVAQERLREKLTLSSLRQIRKQCAQKPMQDQGDGSSHTSAIFVSAASLLRSRSESGDTICLSWNHHRDTRPAAA